MNLSPGPNDQNLRFTLENQHAQAINGTVTQERFSFAKGFRREPAPQNEKELLLRASALEGVRLSDLAEALGGNLVGDGTREKGITGQLIECALGADANAGARPDFVDLDIELKTIPVRPDGRPIESTFVCSIHMGSADQENFDSSRLAHKLQSVLFVPLLSPPGDAAPNRLIGRSYLWRPSAEQRRFLKADFEDLMGEIGAGGASGLTAHQGRILQVRPKAAHSRVRRLAPSTDGAQTTLPLGFYLRPEFTQSLAPE